MLDGKVKAAKIICQINCFDVETQHWESPYPQPAGVLERNASIPDRQWGTRRAGHKPDSQHAKDTAIMSLLARLLLLWQERNQTRCARCGLYHNKQHPQCPHCRDMNAARLKVFLEESGIDPDAKSGLGQFLVLAAVIVVVIFLLSRVI